MSNARRWASLDPTVEVIPGPDGREDVRARGTLDVAELPRRVAHATHALISRGRDAGMPVTAAEVCEYDEEAVSVRATAAALREASHKNLAMNLRGLWVPTALASSYREALERRFLDDTATDGDG